MVTVSDMLRSRSGSLLAALAVVFALSSWFAGDAFADELPHDDLGQQIAMEHDLAGSSDAIDLTDDDPQGEAASGIALPVGHDDAVLSGGSPRAANTAEGVIGKDKVIPVRDAWLEGNDNATSDDPSSTTNAIGDADVPKAADAPAIPINDTASAPVTTNGPYQSSEADNEEQPSHVDATTAPKAKRSADAEPSPTAKNPAVEKQATDAEAPAASADAAWSPAKEYGIFECAYSLANADEQPVSDTQARDDSGEQTPEIASQRLVRRAGSSSPATPIIVEANTIRGSGNSPTSLFALLPDTVTCGAGGGLKASMRIHDSGGMLLYGKARCRSP